MIIEPSKAPSPIKSEKAGFPEKASMEVDLPPPMYEESPQASTSSTTPLNPSLLKPCNYLHINPHHKSISGAWRVDTALVVPMHILPVLPAGVTVRPNLKLETGDGPITADIWVEGKETGLAVIDLSTKDGSIRLRIHDRDNQRLSAKAITSDGSIVVQIPRDFRGLFLFSTKDGRVTFSPEMQRDITTFVDTRKDGKAFLGDWKALGFGQEGVEWTGDQIETRTKDGDIRFAYIDEVTPPTRSEAVVRQIKGWFGVGSPSKSS